MSRKSLGGYWLAAFAAGILATSIAGAQTPPASGSEELRRKAAEGADACRKDLASAPADITLGEVDDFCTCMGVQDAAMSEMPGADRTILLPQLQQICVGIIRKQGPRPPAGQIAAPPAPAASPPPQAVAEPPRAASATVAGSAAPLEKIEQWTITNNRVGAPIAFVLATNTPAVAGFLMYCRARDAIGMRVGFKPGFSEKRVSFPMGGWDIPLVIGSNGLVTQASWALFVKDWLETEKHTPPEIRSRPDYNGAMDITASRRVIGKANLDGLGAARERLRVLCAAAIDNGAPAGNYLTTGIEGFPPEVIIGTPPAGTPAEVAIVGPGAPAAAGKPKPPALGEAECRALLRRSGEALVPRMQQLAATLSSASSQAQFCKGARMNIAFHSEVKQRIAACSAHGFVKKVIGDSNSAIGTTRAQMRQLGC